MMMMMDTETAVDAAETMEDLEKELAGKDVDASPPPSQPQRPSSPSQPKQKVNGKAPTIQVLPRGPMHRSILTTEEIDKELFANMEQLEPGPEYVKVSENIHNSMEGQDLIAILEGDETEVAEISEEQLRKEEAVARELSKANLVEDLMNDWSDNEEAFEVQTKVTSNNAQVVTIVPTKTKATSAAAVGGASKRKASQNTIVDTDPDAGTATVEIIKSTVDEQVSQSQTSPIKIERKRVIKKKVIWDPDDVPRAPGSNKKTVANVSATSSTTAADEKPPAKKPVERKRRRITEIDRLLADEGAINMIYDVERENENSDMPEIKVALEDDKGYSVLDIDEERNNLAKKAKLLKNAVIKQTSSPPSRPIRTKREPAPAQSPTPPPPQKMPTPPKVAAAPTVPATPTPAVSKPQTQAKKAPATKKAKKYENENSMIVRRRSTSSFSDPGSPRRLSDASSAVEDDVVPKSPSMTPDAASKQPTSVPDPAASAPSPAAKVKSPPITVKYPKVKSEFAKPPARKKTKPMDTSILVAQIRGKLAPPVRAKSPVKMAAVDSQKKTPGGGPEEIKKKVSDLKQLSIRKYDKFSYVVLPSIEGKLQDCLTLQLANKIVAALKQLEGDAGCQAVVITSAGVNFCTGINYHLLIQTDEEKRKSAAREYAAAIRKFVFCLATYTKPLICGLRGEVRGIGLMVLPFFDVVLASEDVRLSAPYGLIGHFPEGLSVLRLLGKIKQQTVSECFMLNRKLSAEQGVAHDLVTSVVAIADFNDELLSMARIVSSNMPQAMLTIKASMTFDLREQIDEALKDEETLLIQHWTSIECQEKLRSYAERLTSP